MSPPLKRSFIEFSKRVFLDRLSSGHQPLLQPGNIDEGPGDEYDYGGCYDPFNFGVGGDCSGSNSTEIGAAILGPQAMSWLRQFSTETFPGPFGDYFRKTTKDDLVNGKYVIKVCIMHGGGGPNSHMNCSIDGVVMESNGRYGTCTLGSGAYPLDSDIWNDWWVCDSSIDEDTTWRQPMSYPKGFDYAGGRPSPATILSNGGSFVCRYLSDGGPNLPGKELLADEFTGLIKAGISVVFNWETTADFMLGGGPAGIADATTALAKVRSLPEAPRDPVIYFSCDFDEAPAQDGQIEAYLHGAASVLGTVDHVGMYGPYWILQRAHAAGFTKYLWQTEAWSGGNIDSDINVFQRNDLGFVTLDGVQCDINEAHTEDFGQFPSATPQFNQPQSQNNTGGLLMALSDADQTELLTKVRQLWGATFNTDKQTQSRYAADGEIPHLSTHDLEWNDDEMIHETFVERLAIFGSTPHIQLVVRNARRGDPQAMVIVGKISDADLAAANNYTRQGIQADHNAAKAADPNRAIFYINTPTP